MEEGLFGFFFVKENDTIGNLEINLLFFYFSIWEGLSWSRVKNVCFCMFLREAVEL